MTSDVLKFKQRSPHKMRYGAQNHVCSLHTLSISYFDEIHPALSMIICINCLRQKFLVFNNCQQCNATYVVLTHDALHYRLYGPGIKYWWGQDFPPPSSLALGPTQPPMQRVPGYFQGAKQPGRGINHSPPSSANVKERVELYLHSTSVPLWHVTG